MLPDFGFGIAESRDRTGRTQSLPLPVPTCNPGRRCLYYLVLSNRKTIIFKETVTFGKLYDFYDRIRTFNPEPELINEKRCERFSSNRSGVYEGGSGMIFKRLEYTVALGVAIALIRRVGVIFWTAVGTRYFARAGSFARGPQGFKTRGRYFGPGIMSLGCLTPGTHAPCVQDRASDLDISIIIWS